MTGVSMTDYDWVLTGAVYLITEHMQTSKELDAHERTLLFEQCINSTFKNNISTEIMVIMAHTLFGTGTATGTDTIENNGSWSLSLSRTSVNIFASY